MSRRDGERGQAIVLMVGAIFVAFMIAGLIVDGGNAWVQTRITQNGADATAEAGAAVLAERLALANAGQAATGTTACPLANSPTQAQLDTYWDCRVAGAITAMAAQNHITEEVAYYTDICGTPVPGGAPVGSGTLPVEPPATTCSNSAVLGVEFHAARGFQPIFPIIRSALTARQTATAVAGFVTAPCTTQSQANCRSIQLAIPVNVIACDGSGNAIWATNPPAPYEDGVTVVLPVCKTGPGNFGFVNWSASSGATLPAWLDTVTGRHLADFKTLPVDQIYLIPVFDWVCNGTPTSGVTTQPYGCPDSTPPGADLATLLDSVNPNWYHVNSFRAFRLDQVITSNKGVCAEAQGTTADQNKSTDCLVGRFESLVTTGVVVGTIPGGTNSNAAVGVQLIK